MELNTKKIMPVSELQVALSLVNKKDFILAFGEILIRALKKYDTPSLPKKVSFQVLLDMADLFIDNELYEGVLEEFEEKSRLELKIINFLQNRGWYKPRELDMNELLVVGCTHYHKQEWGRPNEFKEALSWFISELA